MTTEALLNENFCALSNDDLMEIDGGVIPFAACCAIALGGCVVGLGLYIYGYGRACRKW